MSESKPLTPDEVQTLHHKNIPSEVIEAINELLVLKYRRPLLDIRITQREIIDAAQIKFQSMIKRSTNEIFENGWMDFEPVFRNNGWDVSYDRPGWNESYEAFYLFSRKK